jgi:hypothetical protein
MKAAHQFLQPRLLCRCEESVRTKALDNDQYTCVFFPPLHSQHAFQGVQRSARGFTCGLLITPDGPIDRLPGVPLFLKDLDGGDHLSAFHLVLRIGVFPWLTDKTPVATTYAPETHNRWYTVEL